MARTLSIDSSNITTYSQMGRIVELDNGDLILGAIQGNYPTNRILKSVDGGQNWTLKHTFTDDTTLEAKGSYLARSGTIFIGTGDYGLTTPGVLARSADNGETWENVLTVESNTIWHITEDSNGYIYCQEYSSGAQDENELYGYNVWRSIDDGLTWEKYYSAPPQSTPGAKDSIRHIHVFAIDSNDRKYITFGEFPPTYTTELGGRNFRLEDDGTLTLIYYEAGNNGWTAFVEADNGQLYFGADGPGQIYRVDPNTLSKTDVFDITEEWGAAYDSYFFGMAKGRDGVLYAVTIGVTADEIPGQVFASADDGYTWVRLNVGDVTSPTVTRLTDLFINPNSASDVVHVISRSGNSFSISDYTRAELRALYTSTVTINGN